MLLKHLHHSFIPISDRDARAQVWFWLGLSLVCAFVMAWIGQMPAFAGEFTVQDDARQHVFWMRRFLDPGLFPNDLIADYYESLAPAGYRTLYRSVAALGIDPMLFNKLLPFGLFLGATGFAYGVCLQLLPVPIAGFFGAIFLNQNLWLYDDTASGTARSFLFSFFLMFFFFLLRRSLLPCLLAIALQGLFYPQFIFIMSGMLVLRLVRWEHGLKWSGDRRDYVICAAGLVVAFAVLLPYALEVSAYGPQITLEQARTMPEFGDDGRTNFFLDETWKYWLTARRSGLLVWVMPLCIASVVWLPAMMQAPDRFPLVRRLQQMDLLVKFALVSVGLFLAAHLLLFRLYLPSRYSHYSLQMITAILAGLASTILLDALLRWAQHPNPKRQVGAIAAILLFGAGVVVSPQLYDYPKDSYIQGGTGAIYRFFANQPKDILIASLAEEANNLPTFSQRSILVGREYSIPYHMGYYEQMRQRASDLIRAQYSPDLAQVKDFIQRYGVDFWLVDRRYLLTTEVESSYALSSLNDWLKQYRPAIDEARESLAAGVTPAIATLGDNCIAIQNRTLKVLDAQCILAQ